MSNLPSIDIHEYQKAFDEYIMKQKLIESNHEDSEEAQNEIPASTN